MLRALSTGCRNGYHQSGECRAGTTALPAVAEQLPCTPHDWSGDGGSVVVQVLLVQFPSGVMVKFCGVGPGQVGAHDCRRVCRAHGSGQRAVVLEPRPISVTPTTVRHGVSAGLSIFGAVDKDEFVLVPFSAPCSTWKDYAPNGPDSAVRAATGQ